MTPEQKIEIANLSSRLADLEKRLQVGEISNLFAATHEDKDGTVIISANAEGLIYFATILVSLAAESKEGQHFHFDKTSVLSECGKPIIIKFQKAPWQL
jgi:hypothetical protein